MSNITSPEPLDDGPPTPPMVMIDDWEGPEPVGEPLVNSNPSENGPVIVTKMAINLATPVTPAAVLKAFNQLIASLPTDLKAFNQLIASLPTDPSITIVPWDTSKPQTRLTGQLKEGKLTHYYHYCTTPTPHKPWVISDFAYQMG